MAEPGEIISDAQIAASRVRGEHQLQTPRAVAARYVPARDKVEIDLDSGWSVQVPRDFSAPVVQGHAAGMRARRNRGLGFGTALAIDR